MMEEFIDIEYLCQGNEKQKRAYKAIKNLKIMETLKAYHPLLVGTIPIDIDIESSDLDIICEVYDFKKFEQILVEKFGDFYKFSIEAESEKGNLRTVCSFDYNEFIFEIFAQPVKTIHQNAYMHMVVENRILKIVGEKAIETIRDLKRNGYKTEPAFGVYLKLSGDPYEFLLSMYEWNYNQLIEYLRRVNIIV